MAWPEINDSHQRFLAGDGQRTEVAVMSKDNAILRDSEAQHVRIISRSHVGFGNTDHVDALRAEIRHDFRMNVLISKE